MAKGGELGRRDVWTLCPIGIARTFRSSNLSSRVASIQTVIPGSLSSLARPYIECLACAGRTDEALHKMGKCLRYANHLDLYADEEDARGLPLGNFPQALSHLAMISAADYLDWRLDVGHDGDWEL